MEHELKTLPEYFNEVYNENKAFEIRKADRPFSVGDRLRLREFYNGQYTGRECNRRITYILKDAPEFGLKSGFVILSLDRP